MLKEIQHSVCCNPNSLHPFIAAHLVQAFTDLTGKMIPDLLVSIHCPGISFFPVVNNQTTALIHIYLNGLPDPNDGPFEFTCIHNAPYFFPESNDKELITFPLAFNLSTSRGLAKYTQDLMNLITEMKKSAC